MPLPPRRRSSSRDVRQQRARRLDERLDAARGRPRSRPCAPESAPSVRPARAAGRLRQVHAEAVAPGVRERIHQAVAPGRGAMARARVLAAARVDRERLSPPSTGRHLVGVEAGGVDDDARAESSRAPCRRPGPARRSAAAHRRRARQDASRPARRDPPQRADQRLGFDDAGVGRPERAASRARAVRGASTKAASTSDEARRRRWRRPCASSCSSAGTSPASVATISFPHRACGTSWARAELVQHAARPRRTAAPSASRPDSRCRRG